MEGDRGVVRWAANSGKPLPFSRILVTGADGFVGRQLVAALAGHLPRDARLTLATRSPALFDAGPYAQIAFDLENAALIGAAIVKTKPDLVVHLAAQSSVGLSAKSAGQTWSTNFVGSLYLARALADIVPDCTMLFASSVEVYGLTFNHETVTEVSPLRPQSAYARSKAAAELMFADVLPASARLIVARPSNHSGPGQGESFVIPAFAAQVARAERDASPIRVGNLDAERDFLDVRDVIGAYLALIMQADTLPMRSTFNIASGRPIRISVILDRLRELSVCATMVEQDPQRMRPSEVERAAVDVAAIKQAIGWVPKYTLNETLADILAYHQQQNS